MQEVAATEFDDVRLENLRRRSSGKWRTHRPDVLPSSIAEMDFDLAPAIREALSKAIADGDVGYAYAPGTGLASAFAGFAAERWSWTVDLSNVTAVPEVMVGVAELLRILTEPGDSVVVTPPVYPPFFSHLAEVGRRVVEVPLESSGDGWRLPVEGIEEAFAAGARALLLCNPHNPTGHVARPDELLAVAEVVARHDGVLLGDEIHAPLVLPGAEHHPLGRLPASVSERTIVLTSASKGWNIPGLKCAVAVACSDRMRSALSALPVDLVDRVGQLGIVASIAAFEEGGAWLDSLLTYLDDTRRWLPSLLSGELPGIAYRPGEATYLAWLDCRRLGLGDDPAAHFLERGAVALTAGPQFGAGGRGFARLNFGTSRALVAETVRRMAASMAEQQQP